jgi:hypothetical protein
MSSWRGASLSTGTTLPLHLPYLILRNICGNGTWIGFGSGTYDNFLVMEMKFWFPQQQEIS